MTDTRRLRPHDEARTADAIELWANDNLANPAALVQEIIKFDPALRAKVITVAELIIAAKEIL